MKKKILLICLIILSVLLSNITINAKENAYVKKYQDMNTLNFIEKTKNIDISQIKTICTYDYCEDIDGSTKEKSLEFFIQNYLKRIQDSDTRASLKIKGIRITKIILK